MPPRVAAPSARPLRRELQVVEMAGTMRQLPRVMDPSLQCFLLLTATVAARDEDATRQVLRDAALQLEPRQAHKVVDLLQRSITGGGRAWLRRLA